MELETLHWQPGSDEWHGDGEPEDPSLEFGPTYGEALDARFDRHPDAEVSSSQSLRPWHLTF